MMVYFMFSVSALFKAVLGVVWLFYGVLYIIDVLICFKVIYVGLLVLLFFVDMFDLLLLPFGVSSPFSLSSLAFLSSTLGEMSEMIYLKPLRF